MKIEYCQKCDRGIKAGEEKTYIKDGQILCEECYLRATKQEHERAASEKVHGNSQDELEAKSLKKQRKSKKNKDRETVIAGTIGIACAIVILLMILKGLSFNETVDRKYRPTQSRAKTELQTEKRTPEHNLAIIHEGWQVPKDNTTVFRFRYLLEQLDAWCIQSKEEIADMTVHAQEHIRKERGIKINLLSMTEEMLKTIRVYYPEGNGNYAELLAAEMVVWENAME